MFTPIPGFSLFLALVATASASVIYDNFDESGGFHPQSNAVAAGAWIDPPSTYAIRAAARFTVADRDFTLNSVSLPVSVGYTEPTPDRLRVRLTEDNGGVPGATIEVLGLNGGHWPAFANPFTTITTLASAAHPVLLQGRSYWIVTELNSMLAGTVDCRWFLNTSGSTVPFRQQQAQGTLPADPWPGIPIDEPVAFRVEGDPVPQTLLIERQITGIVHHYMPPDPIFPMFPGYVTDEILFDTTGLANVDLSRYQTFKLRLFAPAGQQVIVHRDEPFRSGWNIYYQAGGDVSSHTDPAALAFEGFTGSMPTREYSLFFITVRNTGSTGLTLGTITTSGGHAGDFMVDTTGMAATVAPAGSTTFTVTLNPTGPGERGTTLRVASNDEDEDPFDIALTGRGLSFTGDSDGDGLNDASEFQMAALGFNWEDGNEAQQDLVATYYANANGAGLFTLSQVRALHIDTPLIQRDGAGIFTLTLGLQKSNTLVPGSFQPFAFTAEGTRINAEGKIEYQFGSDDDAAFFLLEAGGSR
jgi:hypothetical protein